MVFKLRKGKRVKDLQTLKTSTNYTQRLREVEGDIAKIINLEIDGDINNRIAATINLLKKYFDAKMPRANILIKEKSKDPESLIFEFAVFWSVYPLKKSSVAALKAYKKLINDRSNHANTYLPTILIGLLKQIKEREHKERKGQWTPSWKYPDTWLRNYCFDDATIFDDDCTERAVPAQSEIKSLSQTDAIKNMISRTLQSQKTYEH